jgi:spore germination protein
MAGRSSSRSARRARKQRQIALVLLVTCVAALLVALFTVGPFGHHLGRPGKPPLGYIRRPLGGRAYRVTAWSLGSLGSLNQATAVRATDEVDFDWYHTHADGSITAAHENLDLVARARDANLNIFATVTNSEGAGTEFKRSIAAAILASPDVRRRHVAALVSLVETKGFDGIDLDWENLAAADRDPFAGFVAELAKALHAKHRFLSIDVVAKGSEPGAWGAQIAFDYRRLGAAVDEFKIMLYSYSGPWGQPGPQAPAAWVDRVLRFAATVVPPSKTYMGIPFFGYDWFDHTTRAFGAATALAATARAHAVIDRDPASGEAVVQYTDAQGLAHTMYFQDETAVRAKLDLLRRRHPHVAGIAIWVMGQEQPAFWRVIGTGLR